MEHATIIHRALQTVSLPTEYIVGVGAIALAVHERPHKGLRPILRPHVLEGSRVPHGFVRDLRDADGMRGRTRTSFKEAAFCGGVHVRLVVGGVEVLSVPAGGEVVDCLGVFSEHVELV